MPYYDRTDVSQVIDINKASVSNEWNICHYWYFLDKGFKFQLDVCDWCHDVLKMSINLSDIAILNIHSADYCCIISKFSKREAVNLMQNIDLTEKNET